MLAQKIRPDILNEIIYKIRNIELPWDRHPKDRVKCMSLVAYYSENEQNISIIVKPSSMVDLGGRNEHMPPHAEVYIGKPIKENLVGEIVLSDVVTGDKDKLFSDKYLDSPDDIKDMPRGKKTKQIPKKIKDRIYEWANKHNSDFNMSNWEYLIKTWNQDNRNYKIEIRDF